MTDAKIEQHVHELIKRIDVNIHDIDAYLQLSTILIENGDANSALELLNRAKFQNPKSVDLDYNLAVAAFYTGDLELAQKILNSLPNTDENRYEKARVYFKLQQFEKALAFILTVKQHDDHYFELLGDIWLSLGNSQEAADAFKKITKPTVKSNFLLGVAQIDHDYAGAQKSFLVAQKIDQKEYAVLKTRFDDLLKLQQGKAND